MKSIIYQSLLLFFLSITTVFSQSFKYNLGDEDEALSKHLIAKEKINLENGDVLIRKGEAIVDIFKQNQYPQQFVRVSKDNRIKHIRDLKDTVVFKISLLDNKPHLFFADASGKLECMAINSENLSNEAPAKTLLRLNSKKGNPKKINNFIFPEIYFSKDASKFAVLQPYVEEKKLTFSVNVFDTQLRSIYTETVRTSFNSSYAFKLKSALLTNDGKVLFSGTDDKNVFSVFSVRQGDVKEYAHKDSANKKFMSYSSILTLENDNSFFYTYSVSRNNTLEKIRYTLLDENLKVTKEEEEALNLTYPPGAAGVFPNYNLLFKDFQSLPNGEHIITAEYATPLPEPDLLGVLLIQKLESGYIFSGPIVAIHLNSDMSLKSAKLITKFKRPNAKLNGHHFILSDNTAHFLFYDSPNNNIVNLVDFEWDLDSNSVSQNIIFKNKDLSKIRFDLNGGFSMNQKQVMLFGLLRKRVLLTLE